MEITLVSIKILVSTVILIATVTVGSVGFHHFERGQNLTWTDSVYFTIVTITTVGYGEIHPQTDAGKLFAIPVITIGVSSALSTLTVLFGALLEDRVRRAVTGLSQPEKYEDHVILCGSGDLAEIVAKELRLNNVDYVRVSREEIPGQTRLIVGDPGDEGILKRAGIMNAVSLVVLLEDREEFFVTLEAKRLRPDLRVVTAVEDPENKTRLEEVGADLVVACDTLSARLLAMASERHFSMGFFDTDISPRPIALSEISIPEGSPVVGKTLAELSIPERFGLSVVALTRGKKLEPNPDPFQELEAGGQIVVFGEKENASDLKAYASGGRAGTGEVEIPRVEKRKGLPTEIRSRGPRMMTNLFLIVLVMVFYQFISPVFSAAGITLNLQEMFNLAIFFVVLAAIGYLLFSVLSDFKILVDAGFLTASGLDSVVQASGVRRIIRNGVFMALIVVLGLVVGPLLGSMGGGAVWVAGAIPWICLGLLLVVLYDMGSFLHGAMIRFVRRVAETFARSIEEGD